MNIEEILKEKFVGACANLYNQTLSPADVLIQKTKKEFEGDFTFTVFAVTRFSKKSPEETGREIGEYLKKEVQEIDDFNVIKGFLNIVISQHYWLQFLQSAIQNSNYGNTPVNENSQTIVIEYPSPNTNKPLHLGHLRNIFLGYSLTEILKKTGNKVIHTCLYNDRGTNISKSMWAWQQFAKGTTPQGSSIKGDHFVGDYYVKFSDEYKKEQAELMKTGITEDEAKQRSELNAKVNEMTVKWENGDKEVRALWKQMNDWVYEGFNETYKTLNITFDRNYYESDVYNLGKETVKEGLSKGVFYQKEDGSVWIDLTSEGLDHKLVLRSNGTTVYITQDIEIAYQKEKEFKFDRSIYVVGNEQDYHFKVLFLILKKLGRKWADQLYHLSYGMVELPTGKMKSREGTVVDADDLVQEMIDTAKEKSLELGKVEGLSENEAQQHYKAIGMAALKYFILKVEPKKRMIFNPQESIDFNGHTGPFIQYTYARIQSVLKKAQNEGKGFSLNVAVQSKEKELIKMIYEYPAVLIESANLYNPAIVANYAYELAKEYNQFYHDIQILKESSEDLKHFRIALSRKVALVVKDCLELLGIEVLERM